MVAIFSSLGMSLPYQFLPDKLIAKTAYYGREVYSHESKRIYHSYTINPSAASPVNVKPVYVINLTGTWSGENPGFARRVRAFQFQATLGFNYSGTGGSGYGLYVAGVRLFVGPSGLASGYYDLDNYSVYLDLDSMPVICSIEHKNLTTEFKEVELVYPYPITIRAGEAIFLAVTQYQVVNLDSNFSNNTITGNCNYDIKFLGH